MAYDPVPLSGKKGNYGKLINLLVFILNFFDLDKIEISILIVWERQESPIKVYNKLQINALLNLILSEIFSLICEIRKNIMVGLEIARIWKVNKTKWNIKIVLSLYIGIIKKSVPHRSVPLLLLSLNPFNQNKNSKKKKKIPSI